MSESFPKISPDETLESTTLASRTFDSIKADIINGELAQGTKIVESDLALKYGISRGPLREAIHRLEQIKLIVRIPHAGSRVITLDAVKAKLVSKRSEPFSRLVVGDRTTDEREAPIPVFAQEMADETSRRRSSIRSRGCRDRRPTGPRTSRGPPRSSPRATPQTRSS